ncbi:hypothetical protein [Methanolapillus millepedarum]|uniref:DUF7847 domain-containing protein n=1 Tax=Methanolapillus millepedarum TaxID=3028296 RepID=A0AA96ZTT2_9EURY|nr:hypothetical protein MsAc7_03560 [Methanosarcinaceae archaeon Ac7]
MSENLMDTLSKGFSHFSKNPILCAPVLLMYASIILITFAFVFVLVIVFGAALFSSPTAGVPDISGGMVGALLIALLLFVVVTLIISSYITAGLTGMCKEVETTGKTVLSDMSKYGNKSWFRVLISTVLTGLLSALSIVFLIPAIFELADSGVTSQMWLDAANSYAAGNLFAYEQIVTMAMESAAFSLTGGLLLMLVYLLIITFVFYFMTYAIVIDDLSVTAGIKKSWSLLKTNPGTVIWFIIVVIIITGLISLIGSFMSNILASTVILSFVGVLISLILKIVIIVLVTIWTTRKYLILTGQPLYEEEDLLSY